MQVGGLLILTTGLAHYALMQHTPPLRALYVPLFLFFSLQSSYKIPSNLYVYKYRLGWIMVWVGVSFFFSFFLFGTRRSDVLFVTVPCFHLNADWLGSQLKHIPCSRTTLDIPMGFFFQVVSFAFCAEFYTATLPSKLKTSIGNSHGGERIEGSPFPIRAKYWQITRWPMWATLKKQGDPNRLLVVLNEIRAWNGVGMFVRDTQWSLHCAKLIGWLNVAKKKLFKKLTWCQVHQGTKPVTLQHPHLIQVCPHNM